MKVARYVGNGKVMIVDEPVPYCPEGGLLIQTRASGLCSGELMSWYMDQKIPHVLGHEVSGLVIESEDARFKVGDLVFPHHHAPCLKCQLCAEGLYVHCEQWRKTKLVPGGMVEFFGVPGPNLNDTLVVNDLRAQDAALIEPLACVMKAFKQAPPSAKESGNAVIGLGVMGLMHLILLAQNGVGYDLNQSRVAWAQNLGLEAKSPVQAQPADVVYVCPGSQAAFDLALSIVRPGGTVVMFAPLGPSQELKLPQDIYFKDIKVAHSYSCGPDDTLAAATAIRNGKLKAEQVISQFIGIDELPTAYEEMKAGKILKPMVIFE